MTPSDHLHIEFGNAIRDERLRQNLSVADVVERLRASVEHVEAVEAGNVKAFPSETYFQLFAKSYARELGIDYARTIEAMTGQEEIAAEEENLPGESQASYSHHRPMARSHNPLTILQRPGMLFVILAVITGGLLLVAKFVRTGNEASGEGKAIEAGMNPHDTMTKSATPDTNYVMHFTLTTIDPTFARVVADGDTVVAESLKAGKSFMGEAKRQITIFAENPSAVACSINGHRTLYDSTTQSPGGFVVNPENIHSMLDIKRSPFAPSEMMNPAQSNTLPAADSARRVLGGNR